MDESGFPDRARAGFALLLATACVTATPPTGRVDYEMLPDPAAAMPALSGRQVFIAPVPLEAPLPEYPPEALGGSPAPVTVVVRIVVRDDGTVPEVLESPLGGPEKPANGKAFRAAVDRTVRTWRFRPAYIRTMAEGEDINHDGKSDYDVLVEETAISTYLDLRFTFEIVDGRGSVRAVP